MPASKPEPDTAPAAQEPPRSAWQEYEVRKQAWREAHPFPTPAEYEAAIRRIAEDVGV